MTAYPRRETTKQLGEILLERSLINAKQLQEALEIQKSKGGLIGEILVSLGFVREEDIAKALTTQFGLPYLPLSNYEIDPEVIKLVPENVARQYNLIPLDKIADTLTITVSNPLNIQAIEDIEFLTNCNIQIFVSTMSEIKGAIKKYYSK